MYSVDRKINNDESISNRRIAAKTESTVFFVGELVCASVRVYVLPFLQDFSRNAFFRTVDFQTVTVGRLMRH